MENTDCFLKIYSNTPPEFIYAAQRVVQLCADLTGKTHHLHIYAYSGVLKYEKYKGLFSRKLYENKDEIRSSHEKLANLLKTCGIPFKEQILNDSLKSLYTDSILGREEWGYNSEIVFEPDNRIPIPRELEEKCQQLRSHPALIGIRDKAVDCLKTHPEQYINPCGIIVNYGATKISVSNSVNISVSEGYYHNMPEERYGSGWNSIFFDSFGMDSIKDNLTLFGFVLASIKEMLEEVSNHSASLLLIDKTVATRYDEGCVDVMYRYDMSFLFKADNTETTRKRLSQW